MYTNTNFCLQVTFDGQIGSGIQGDIAIDDVIFTSGACTGVIPTFSPVQYNTQPTVTYRELALPVFFFLFYTTYILYIVDKIFYRHFCEPIRLAH